MKGRMAATAAWAIAGSLMWNQSAWSQQQPAPLQVAIVDLSRVFEQYGWFQSQHAALKEELDQALQQQSARQEQLIKMGDELKRYEPNSIPYKNFESQWMQDKAQFSAASQLQKKEFIEREARLYFDAYRQVSAAVEQIARNRQLALVLRYNGRPLENANPREVMEQINRAVLYHHPHIDITPAVLQLLNQQTARSSGPLPASRR